MAASVTSVAASLSMNLNIHSRSDATSFLREAALNTIGKISKILAQKIYARKEGKIPAQAKKMTIEMTTELCMYAIFKESGTCKDALFMFVRNINARCSTMTARSVPGTWNCSERDGDCDGS